VICNIRDICKFHNKEENSMPVGGPGPYQLRVLSARLREAGKEGQGLRRELYKAINQAAKPLAAEIRNPENLRSHMPDRYADVLAGDLNVSAAKRAGRNPGVSIRARSGKGRKRKVALLDQGVIRHPVYGNRKNWKTQTSGMRAGFFEDPARKAAPAIRDQVVRAMATVAGKITS
jgi:hypothetical protein